LLFDEVGETLSESRTVAVADEARETVRGYDVDIALELSLREWADDSKVLRLKTIQISLEPGGQMHCVAVFPGMGERVSDTTQSLSPLGRSVEGHTFVFSYHLAPALFGEASSDRSGCSTALRVSSLIIA
jgi:hypothetical protein